MKVKHLKKGEYRVIKVDRDALWELFIENMMENGAEYFDLLDSTTVTFHMRWDKETDELVCLAHDSRYPLEIDLDRMADEIGKTTGSLYERPRYKTVICPERKEDGTESVRDINGDTKGYWMTSGRLL